MTKEREFEVGRIQGENGWVGSTYDSDAYRQGVLVGETQRQSEILLEQHRKAERQALEAKDKERQDALELEWAREREEEEAQRYEDEGHRSRSLVAKLERMVSKHAQLAAIERDALYFATQSALHFESAYLDFQRLVREAGATAAETLTKEPALNESLLRLGMALHAFRGRTTSHGIVLPFRACYLRNELPRENLNEPCFEDTGERPAWLSAQGSWLSEDTVQAFDVLEKTLQDPGAVVDSLAGELSELRKLAATATAGGLWRVPPDFLAYSTFKGPGAQDLFSSPAEVVDLIFSHSDFLAYLENSKDEAEIIRKWVLVPNQQVAVFLSKIEEGREVVTKWMDDKDSVWPRIRDTAVWRQGNVIERLLFVWEFQTAINLINKRRLVVNRPRSNALEHPDTVQEKDRREELEEIRLYATRRRPQRRILEACLLEGRRDAGEWSLVEVDRRTAQSVCSLIGPFYFISQREALLGCAAGIVLGAVLFSWGAELTGFLTVVASLSLGVYCFSLASHYMPDDISHNFAGLARRAYRACPTLTPDQKYRELYQMVADQPPAEKGPEAGRTG